MKPLRRVSTLPIAIHGLRPIDDGIYGTKKKRSTAGQHISEPYSQISEKHSSTTIYFSTKSTDPGANIGFLSNRFSRISVNTRQSTAMPQGRSETFWCSTRVWNNRPRRLARLCWRWYSFHSQWHSRRPSTCRIIIEQDHTWIIACWNIIPIALGRRNPLSTTGFKGWVRSEGRCWGETCCQDQDHHIRWVIIYMGGVSCVSTEPFCDYLNLNHAHSSPFVLGFSATALRGAGYSV